MGRTAPTTLAAIGALFPVRVADTGNSSVAALGNAGTFTGVWKSTAGMARFDISLTNAATLNLITEHSDDGANAIAGDTETWPASAEAHAIYPTPCKRAWYRVRMVDTGGGGAITLATTLDPRPIDHEQTLIPEVAVGSGGYAVRPLGARSAIAACGGGRNFYWTTAAPATAMQIATNYAVSTMRNMAPDYPNGYQISMLEMNAAYIVRWYP
jgi:hypothetical protein